jgi:hypothetical protein
MEKHLQVLSQALNKANLNGAYTMQESAIIMQSLGVIAQAFQPNPIADAREEAKMQVADDKPKARAKTPRRKVKKA